MCEDCKYVSKDKKLQCMNQESEECYKYVSKYFVCDEYEPQERSE